MLRLLQNFDVLRDLQDCANDLLQSPVTQQALVHHRHEKWVDEVAEGSLRMLDVCGTSRDVLLLVREHLQDMHSALRRRSAGKTGFGNKIDAYNFSRKKMKKQMFKCLGALKQMNKCAPSPLSNKDPNLLAVVIVLREVRVTTISILESILSFMSTSRPKFNSNRLFFISKFVRVKRVASTWEEAGMNEVGSLDTALCALHAQNFYFWKKSEVVGIQAAKKELEALENAIEDLEAELEYMFRRLIQTRVSLLNILNN